MLVILLHDFRHVVLRSFFCRNDRNLAVLHDGICVDCGFSFQVCLGQSILDFLFQFLLSIIADVAWGNLVIFLNRRRNERKLFLQNFFDLAIVF